MAATIQIKRSASNGTSISGLSLSAGELAVTLGTGTQANQGDRLYVGDGSNVDHVGGKYFMDMLDHVHGTNTGDSALITDTNGYVDTIKVGKASTAGIIDLMEGDGGSARVRIQAPNSLASDITFTLPVNDGNADQFLQTNGSGVMSWATVVSDFTISDNAGTPNTTTFSTGDTFKIAGGTNITSTLADSGTTTTVTLNVATATDSVLGVASFATADFAVSSGAVTIKADGVSYSQIQNVVTANRVLGSSSADGVISEVQITNAMVDNSAAIAVSKTALAAGTGITLSTNTLSVDADQSSNINAVANLTVGSGSADASVQSDGNHNLILKTGNSTTGNITITDGANGNIVMTPDGTGTVTVPSNYSSRGGFVDDSLVPKTYVDAVANGLDVKKSVRVATTAALSATYNNGAGTLTASSNGAISIDGVTLTANDRVLVKDFDGSSNPTHVANGFYKVTTVGDGSTAYVLTRTPDGDEASELTGGAFTFVEEGTSNADNGYVASHNGTPTVGTNPITFEQFSGAGQISAGSGLTKTGNQINAIGSATVLAAADALSVNSSSTQYQILVSGGTAGASASWGALSLNQTDAVSGQLPVASGGTGLSGFTAGDMMYASGTTTVAKLAKGTAGQFMIMNGGATAPSWTSTIDGGTF